MLEKGSVEEALKAANAVLKKGGIEVKEGVADLEKLLPPRVTMTVLDRTRLPVVQLRVEAEAGSGSSRSRRCGCWSTAGRCRTGRASPSTKPGRDKLSARTRSSGR